MNREELELKLEKQCKRLCKITNEFNQLRSNIESTKKELSDLEARHD